MMIGQSLSHYRVLARIGAGGMGEVYRARDEHLGRDVAIKVLPAGILADEHARKRFRKEAEALSKLNHPHIATVHDFDTQEGVDFLVMEYVEGTSLKEKLVHGALLENEVVRLGAQIAEGLEEAHDRGVVHRDLKPGNIGMTPKDQIKVLDFGLATLVRPLSESATTADYTQTGTLPGTLPYMAPEQLRGTRADLRSDLYSFGVVLYEMATGRRPFEEKLATALADSILHEPPSPPGRLKPDLSPRLEEIILKCLEKDPENRYQTAKELLVDLRRLESPERPRALVASPQLSGPRFIKIAGLLAAALIVAGYFARERFRLKATPPSGKIMMAVLPFDNLSADAEQEYFSDGLTEEMIAQLGQLQPRRLGVIARTSVMLYKDTHKPVDQIGQELGVDYLLEGSVRSEADRVRITAQLIQVSDQTHLWAKSYERALTDVFGIQSEVAGRIASSLAMELLPAEKSALARAPTSNAEAHEAYLKGRYHWNKRTLAEFEKALVQFQHAIELDPDYALAYTGLADTYSLLGNYGGLPQNEARLKAKAAALKALEIDETLAEAHTSLAGLLGEYELDWLGAEREFLRATALSPNYATAHHWYSGHLAAMGRPEEGLAEMKRAYELDPLSLRINVDVGRAYYFAGQYDAAIEQYLKTLELEPNFSSAHSMLGLAYVATGRYQRGIAEIKTGAGDGLSIWLGYAHAMAGERGQARAILEEWKKRWDQSSIGASAIALIHVGLGENGRAFEWLERSLEERTGVFMIKAYPYWDPVRSDPRFQDLLRRMDFPP